MLPLVDQQRQTLLQDITADSVWGPTALLIVVRMVDLAQLAVREMLGELKGGKAKRVFVEKIDKLRSASVGMHEEEAARRACALMLTRGCHQRCVLIVWSNGWHVYTSWTSRHSDGQHAVMIEITRMMISMICRSTLEPRSANLEQLVDPVFGAWADMVEGIADQQRVERKDAFKVAAAYQPLPPGQVVQLPAQQHMPAAQPPLYPAPYPPPPSSRPFKGPQTQVPERAIFGMGKGATDSQILQISISVASKQHMSWVSAPTRPSLCRPFRAIMPR